jgi:tripartite-type tricarboxylate transporter receptor subunit TctC
MKKARSVIINALIAITGMALVFTSCSGKKEYPSKDIQFYVNANAGGGTDAICRKIGQLAEKDLGGSFFMVNKPGVSDSVGPNLLMGSKPDGYTLGNITYGGVVTAVYQEMIPGYDLKKLTPICLVTEESDAIMVGKDTPYQTIDDLIQAAKAKPGQIPVGDQGIGSRVNLVLRKVEAKYGVEFRKISYTSSAPQIEAMLNKEIEVAITSLGDFASLLQSGEARGLVEFSTVRNKAYPTVPTSTELNMGPEVLSSSFVAVAAPAGTPQEIIQKLEDAFRKAATSQEFIDWTTTVGVTPRVVTGAELSKFISDVQARDFSVLDELKKEGVL